jgi:hypothetical protein
VRAFLGGGRLHQENQKGEYNGNYREIQERVATFIALRRSQLGHFREELWLPIALAYTTLAGSPPQASIYGYLLGRLGLALFGSSRHLAKRLRANRSFLDIQPA